MKDKDSHIAYNCFKVNKKMGLVLGLVIKDNVKIYFEHCTKEM